MERTKVIKVAEDFSPFPAGRTKGNTNGELFLEKFLAEAVKSGKQTVIDFNGVMGLPSSFLEEAFGGMVRKKLISSIAQFNSLFEIIATDAGISNSKFVIEKYVTDALKS